MSGEAGGQLAMGLDGARLVGDWDLHIGCEIGSVTVAAETMKKEDGTISPLRGALLYGDQAYTMSAALGPPSPR